MSLSADNHLVMSNTWNDSRDRASPESNTDEALLQRLVAGDAGALGELFDRYAKLVFSVALRIIRDKHEAEELLQEVFLYVQRKSHTFDPSRGDCRNWLVQLTYYQAFGRRQRLLARRLRDEVDVLECEQSLTIAPEAELKVLRAESLQALQAALNKLPERQRSTVCSYFFEGLSLREISERNQESLSNTRHHFYRALEKLKQELRSESVD